MTGLYRVRPISDRSPFLGEPGVADRNLLARSSWSSTLGILRRELDALRADDVVLEIDVRERDIRVDGELRADASTARTSPAVRLAYATPSGPMQFATDWFGWDYYNRPKAQGWQENVRAIALGLEALRKVERYGIAQSGQQYTGYRQIECAHTGGGMSIDVALEILRRESGAELVAGELAGPELRDTVRWARVQTHPDRQGGDRSRYDAVDRAVQTLEQAGRL